MTKTRGKLRWFSNFDCFRIVENIFFNKQANGPGGLKHSLFQIITSARGL